MRKNILNAKHTLVLFAMLVVLTCSSSALAGGATITVINVDGPNEGFNDPTPAAPVGGNTGTTKGQQRLIAFQHAANLWGATLDSPVEVFVTAAFNPLGANVLGSAGATFVFSDFGSVGLYPGPEFANTWYGSALADKRAGAELNPGFADINSQFSSDFNFYLGLDNNHGAQVDLVVVVLHELGHGLNFQNFVNESTGANLAGQTDIYARHTFDNTTGLTWDVMTQAQRQASAINWGNVIWDGATVTAAVPSVLVFGSPEVRVLTPASIAGIKQFGTAAFGTPISSMAGPVSGNIVPAVDAADAAGPTTTDGCSALTNAAAIAGNIALVERGTCGFVVKAKVAQDAGAVAVIIYNNAANAAAGPPGMAGVDPTVTIPSVSFSRTDGLAVVNNQPVTGSIGPNFAIRAGADAADRARLFMPNPVQGGSSGSHYDSIAFKNLLMEPAINSDLTHDLSSANGNDLTLELMRDVGWFPDADNDGAADADDCEPNSDFTPTVIIDGCDSGVPNFLFVGGCTFSDFIAHIAESSKNHGQFVARVNQLLNQLKKNGTITAAQKDAISSCAAGASIP